MHRIKINAIIDKKFITFHAQKYLPMTNNLQKRITVTGGSGFIGTNLVEFF